MTFLMNLDRGATFSEVLVAMGLTVTGLMGTMAAFQAAEKIIEQGVLTTRALAMVESRLEAKRSIRWEQLLMDDLDEDGLAETVMHDDGAGADHIAGDGIYSARCELNGVVLTWMVAPNNVGNLMASGFTIIEARAAYRLQNGEHELRLATIRANPVFAGSH